MYEITITLDGTPQLNGREMVHYEPEEQGCRALWTDEDLEFILKVEYASDLNQFATEQLVWDELEDKDRKHFTEPLAGGHNGRWCWSLSPFLHDAEDEYCRPEDPEMEQFVKDLFDKYQITDYGKRQWKLVRGVPVIHDFGCSRDRYKSDEHNKKVDSLAMA